VMVLDPSLVRESLKWDLHGLVGLVYVPELSVGTAELVAWTVTVPAHIEEHRRRVGCMNEGSVMECMNEVVCCVCMTLSMCEGVVRACEACVCVCVRLLCM
jgi:hypothetical protein